MIVADTSLIIAAVGNSAQSVIARRVFQLAGVTVAPKLWRYEFAQWVGVKVRAKTITQSAADQLCANGERLINREMKGLRLTEIVEASYRHTVSSYDAVFVRCAERLECRIVTNDVKLIRACPLALSIEDFLDAPQ